MEFVNDQYHINLKNLGKSYCMSRDKMCLKSGKYKKECKIDHEKFRIYYIKTNKPKLYKQLTGK
jgi:hypothetical protein